MINDEKRREVAARLREVKKTGFDFTWCKICMVVCGTECPVGCDEDEMAVDAARRLADLIETEPERTCRMKKIGGDRVLAGWWECSECGPVYPPCKDEIAKWALRKCPHCGAKVVDE